MTRRSNQKNNRNRRKTSSGEVRIIAGKWRGRKLPVIDADGLRPTGDRARETLFNWLQADLAGARCLDLFAGTGVLGLEALSRGASMGLLLECQRTVAEQLVANCKLLKADTADVEQVDTLAYIEQINPDAAFDVVFLDPPWRLDCYQKVLNCLVAGDWITAGSLIFCEMHIHATIPSHSQLIEIKRKIIGEARLMLFRYGDIT